MQRDLGRHDAESEFLQKEISEMRQELKKISSILSEAQGSWRAMVAMSGIAATLGAIVVKYWPHQ